MTEFKELISYRDAFKTTRILALTVIVLCIGLTGFIYYQSIEKEKQMLNNIWIKTQDGSMFSAERVGVMTKEDRVIEYKHHVKWFYNMWYTLNKDNQENNINAALNLIEKKPGEELLDYYISQNVFQKISQTGRSFISKLKGEPEIHISTNGIIGRVYGTIDFYDEQRQVYRKQHLDVEFALNDVIGIEGRSNINPHAVKIASWNVINDKEVKNNE
ncbi:MAG: hypothetical protein CVT95_09450 [Bacteroidetes bacterium HGW-Bacteroidetes-12]|nr:MAG: hypothetical protein CVT95_09450 [Bacteroidetes bacterium HGW-Bacteroidetes-12]